MLNALQMQYAAAIDLHLSLTFDRLDCGHLKVTFEGEKCAPRRNIFCWIFMLFYLAIMLNTRVRVHQRSINLCALAA